MKEFGIGGAERLLLELDGRLDDVEFLPVAVVDEPTDLVPSLEAAGMSPVSLGARHPFDATWMRRLRKLVRETNPDIVHVQNPYPAAGARLALRGLDVPLVYTEHNVWESFHRATRLANAATFWLNDASIVVSDGVRDSIGGTRIGRLYKRRLMTIRNGIDPAIVRSDAASGTDLDIAEGSYGTVGHLNASKAPDNLIAAAALLRERGHSGHCYIVGDGPLAAESEIYRRSLNATHVHLLGLRTDARAITARLKVFAIASRFEGLPMVLLEALALGIPVVTTDAGGIGEVIKHGETGLLVPKDDPHALAEAIERVLMDDDLAARLAKNGRELVEGVFHIASTASSLHSAYEGVL